MRFASAVVLLSLIAWACGGEPRTGAIAPGPPTSLAPTGTDEAAERCLIAFFPGLGDTPSAFETHGFIDRLRAAQVVTDVEVVEANDYSASDYTERLHDELLARRSGPVWLVGISMGNSALLRYASNHPDEVTGVVLIAPVIGGPFLTKRVIAAGSASAVPGDDRDSRAIRWLGDRRRSDGTLVEAYLAYGRQDSLAPLAEAVRRDVESTGGTVIAGGGGHSWEVWSEYWSAFVDTGFFQRSCGTLRVP